jgi:hypothetical protein
MAAEVMQIEHDYDKRQGREWPALGFELLPESSMIFPNRFP